MYLLPDYKHNPLPAPAQHLQKQVQENQALQKWHLVVMVAAVKSNVVNMEKASSLWLIMSYGVITVGELCLSPMGLSLVSKLSPPRITSLMMGGWFLSTSIGNMLSGILATFWDNYDNKMLYFMDV